MLGLSWKEWMRIVRTSGLVCLTLTGLTLLCDLIGMSDIVTVPAGFIMVLGVIVAALMYILDGDPIEYMTVFMTCLAAGLGASIGILIISLYRGTGILYTQ